MDLSEVQAVLSRIEQQLAGVGTLDAVVAQAVEELLNLVERLVSGQQALAQEVERLKAQLQQKKKHKTTHPGDGPQPNSDHSSEKHRRQRQKSKRQSAGDRRTFKDLPIHETVECPVDPTILPPDAVRLGDETVIVQDIEIKPKNTQFQRHVYYSAAGNAFFRGPLPGGFDQGAFSANLRALIVSLKYCGAMSEPKIGEFLENFNVRVSSGSISNILTRSAKDFEQDYHEVLVSGLSSTPYQQTDDTSARVDGSFWHTHILCNPYYTLYSTRPRKDRLAVLEVLQNTGDLRFYLGQPTLDLLESQFSLPRKWQRKLADLGEVELTAGQLKTLLDEWFGERNAQLRTAIEQAAAIVYYHHQRAVPVIETIVCDDAGQFKLLTEKLALCWIHEGRHYEKLSPVVGRHVKQLDSFLDRYWDYYTSLQDYRASPAQKQAAKLRLEFDELFSTRTGYDDLDARIAKTAAKKGQLLTVLSAPSVPLHNNASELGARVSARRRDVSLHSRSVRGARAMDVFTTLAQTSKKLGVSAFEYLHDRLSGADAMPSLAQIIRQASQSPAASG